MDNKKLSMEELHRLSVQEFKNAEKTPIVVVLDNVRSMNNIGSIFRSCDGFGVEKLCLCGITATPPNREINKTALGATESVEWEYFTNTIDCIIFFKNKGYKIFCIEQTSNSTMLQNFDFPLKEHCLLVFGNEIEGVSQEIIDLADQVIEIPQFGTKHSLNVAVTCGIVLWDCVRKIRL